MHDSARASARAVVICVAIALGSCARSAGDGSGDRIHNAVAYEAWRSGRSHVAVTLGGSIVRVLGTRMGRSGAHAGFLLHLAGAEGRGLTVRVEDNVALTGPIPLHEGAFAEVRGEYLFDPRGGIVHYTHHDPRGQHPAGYVLVDGKFYQ